MQDFKKLTDRFFEDLAGTRRPITIKDYRADMRIYIRWLEENSYKASNALNSRTIADFKNHLIKTSSLANSRRRLFCLKSFCKWAIKWDYLDRNPFDKIDMPAKPKNIPEYLEKFELEYILRTPGFFKKENSRLNVGLMLLFFRDTMIRRRELISLSVQDIDFQNGFAKIHGKGGKIAYQPLSDDILRFLKAFKYHEGKGPLFKSHLGKRWSFTAVGKIFKECVEEAHELMEKDGVLNKSYRGLKGRKITPHTIRHTMATLLLREGARIEDIQGLLRHADISTTKIYLHLKPDHLKEKLEKFNPFLHSKGGKDDTSSD